jgi:hypothetical protein
MPVFGKPRERMPARATVIRAAVLAAAVAS